MIQISSSPKSDGNFFSLSYTPHHYHPLGALPLLGYHCLSWPVTSIALLLHRRLSLQLMMEWLQCWFVVLPSREYVYEPSKAHEPQDRFVQATFPFRSKFPVDGAFVSFYWREHSNKSRSRILFCQGTKEIFICSRGLNRSRIAGLVGGCFPFELAGPSCQQFMQN